MSQWIEAQMIVITRNDKTTVLTGWRAWIATAAMLTTAWCALAFIAFVLVGIAFTIGAALIIIVPALIVTALVRVLLRRQ